MKSYFVFPAAIVSGLLLLASLGAAVLDEDARVAWLGAALANLPLPAFIGRTLTTRIVRTSDNLPLLLLVAAVGAALAAWETVMRGRDDWPALAVALCGALLLLLYVFWLSRFGRYAEPRLAVGNKVPEFTFASLGGDSISAADFRGRPAIFLFYQGNRCPFCVGQVHEIAARHADLEKLGIRLALISPQPVDATRSLAADTGASAAFFTDSDRTAAKALGIDEPRGVLPTIIVTNANGTILYSDQTDNYRVRPEPDIYISILKRAGATIS